MRERVLALVGDSTTTSFTRSVVYQAKGFRCNSVQRRLASTFATMKMEGKEPLGFRSPARG